ncbi:MAG: hypothetical protein QM786_00395 [Breznakibacter sp.]
MQGEEEGAIASWTIFDKKHTLLFNHIYDNNNMGTISDNLVYQRKIEDARKEGTKTLNLDYSGNEEKDWVKQWKISTASSDEILEKVINKIRNAAKESLVPKITLSDKGIYIGKYEMEGVTYPIAVYSENAVLDKLTKVYVTEVDEITNNENKKHVYCEETFVKYLVISFFQSGETEPSLMIQIEKFDISKLQNTKEIWLRFLGILESSKEKFLQKESSGKLEITEDQLRKIFSDTEEERIKEVVESINKYSAEFEINTIERMAHFIGQIGAETSGLTKLRESHSYSPRSIAKTFPYPKYGHLFDVAVLDTTTYEYSYDPIDYDEDKCIGDKISRGDAIFSYSNSDEIRNAYAEVKSETMKIVLNGKATKINVYGTRTDITKDNIESMVSDRNYNSGRLRVKSKYINSSALFDVTYACRMGNGTISSKDGSTFLGKGFIHLTGKGQYKTISDEWNRLYPNDKKEFDGKDIDLLETNVDIAMKASMIYWKLNNLNDLSDDGMDEDSINIIGAKVNGANPPNSPDLRIQYTETTYKNLK